MTLLRLEMPHTESGGVEAGPKSVILRTLGSPVGFGLMAFAAYFTLAALQTPSRFAQSNHPYFIYLAESLLKGQLALVSMPPTVGDLVYYKEHLYLYWPPFPAVVYMPLVVIGGIGVSDAYVHILAGALNVTLVAILWRELERAGIASLSPGKQAWLTAFFALGTVHTTLAPYASVWTTAQVFDFTLVVAATVVALRAHGRGGAMIAGALAGCAFLTRNPSIFAMIWVGQYFVEREFSRQGRRAWSIVACASLPILGAFGAFALYNHARFGNPFDVGFNYHLMANNFVEDFSRYGGFSLHYLPTNLYYYLLAIPYTALLSDQRDYYFWMGGSLFLLSPLFFYALVGVARSWRSRGWQLALSCIVGITPALLLMGTGWTQFGPRYTLDITVPLLVATAVGVQRAPQRRVERLTLVSIGVYVSGALLYGRLIPM